MNGDDAIASVLELAALIVPLVFAIVCHEVAHGWVARALGDPTAARRRRLTLNPLRHIDPIGTVLLPGALALLKAPVFGWAKPVPVDKRRLRNPRVGMMLVAAAGPATNFALAALAATAIGLLARFAGAGAPSLTGVVGIGLANFLAVNLFLGLFNLLPVPPFDGSHIVEGALPARAARGYARLRPYGLPIMVALLLVLPTIAPRLGIVEHLVMPPFVWAASGFDALARRIAGA